MSVQILSRQESKTDVFVKKTGLFAILLDKYTRSTRPLLESTALQQQQKVFDM